MAWSKHWFLMVALGGTLLTAPTGYVVAPLEPGYVASPPAVIIRPYRHYHVHPYRPYEGYPYGYRW